MEQLLASLRDVAPRHAFITGTPVAEKMRELGYGAVSRFPYVVSGIHLTVALGEGACGVATVCEFPSEQASSAKLEEVACERTRRVGHRRVETRDTRGEREHGGVEQTAASRHPWTRHAIRIVNGDSSVTEAVVRVHRRVASRRQADRAVDVELTFASWRETVAAHAVEHFNAARWAEPGSADVEHFPRGESTRGVGVWVRVGSRRSRLVWCTSRRTRRMLEEVDADTVYIIGGIVDLAGRVAWSLPRRTPLESRRASAHPGTPAG